MFCALLLQHDGKPRPETCRFLRRRALETAKLFFKLSCESPNDLGLIQKHLECEGDIFALGFCSCHKQCLSKGILTGVTGLLLGLQAKNTIS